MEHKEEMKQILRLKRELSIKLTKYGIENNVDRAQLFLARKMLDRLVIFCYREKHTAVLFLEWLSNGSTLILQKLLKEKTSYYEDNLTHYNAFALLDTVNIKDNETTI